MESLLSLKKSLFTIFVILILVETVKLSTKYKLLFKTLLFCLYIFACIKISIYL